MQEIITVKNLSKSYGNKKVVENLNFSVEKGKIFGLLGANGAGKSTSIECILGIKDSDKGIVSIIGMNSKKERKLLFEEIGVQFQEANYQQEIKVEELCEETSSFYKKIADYENLLDQFGLSDKRKNLVKNLSGGERQRLFIVLALIPNPQIVFLDELTTGLDVRARRDVWKHLKSLKEKGLTMILTSHFMDEVEALCDEICILNKGKTVFIGSCEQAIKKSPYDKLEDAYLWFTDEEVESDENV